MLATDSGIAIDATMMAFQCKFTNAQGTSCREQERAKSGTCPWTLQNDAIFIDQRVATCSRAGLPGVEFESLSENAGDEADPAERGGL